MAEPTAKPKVVYVLGAHRSGSTVLGVTLGNCDGVFFAGELHSWLTRKGMASFGGEQGARLWGAIAEQVPGREQLFGHDTQLYLDRSSVIFRWREWSRRRELRAPYLRIYDALYHAIARQTGSGTIVDTSHYPLRAIELQAIEGIELYLLFLVRDPQGVVDSFDSRNADSPSKSALVTNLQLWVTHLLCVLAYLRHPRERRIFVRHEQFLADPEGVVAQLLEWTGSDAPVPDMDALRTGSPLQGNRFLKRSDVIALRRSPSPVRRSLLTKAMQLPVKAILALMRPRVSLERVGRTPTPARPDAPDPGAPTPGAVPDPGVTSHGTG
ncbi:MAG TPA: sulfotransferase [Solirubrobacteraceae bacterium]|nr:sulfotransferase [Solirubrobacteraceae bacterium]